MLAFVDHWVRPHFLPSLKVITFDIIPTMNYNYLSSIQWFDQGRTINGINLVRFPLFFPYTLAGQTIKGSYGWQKILRFSYITYNNQNVVFHNRWSPQTKFALKQRLCLFPKELPLWAHAYQTVFTEIAVYAFTVSNRRCWRICYCSTSPSLLSY